MARKSKKEMLDIMKDNHWHHSFTEKDSWQNIKDEYDTMRDECSDDSIMFPNGRDYEAENEDGPC